MRISGCVITKNEEANIANCINNLKCITDEIIIVDTGSEDKTSQIAKELGASVYEHKWEDNFSKAKNAALKHATGDWIIFLDADEYFSDDSLPKVRSVIQKTHTDRDKEGIICELVNIDTDNNKIIGTYGTLRIFRNARRYRFINRIHEEIRNDGKVLRCIDKRYELSIIHTGYSASISQKKVERNLELLLANKDDEKADYYLATSYQLLGDYKNALKYAEAALSNPKISQYDYLAYKLHLIRIVVMVGHEFHNKEKINEFIDEANGSYENHPEIARVIATYYFKEKLYEKALEKLFFALEIQEKNGKSWTQNDFEGKLPDVYFTIAEILYFMNRETDSLNYYVKLLNLNKYHEPGFKSMLKLFRGVPEDDTITFLNSIYDVNKEDDIRFLISNISETGMSTLVLYYAIKWNKTFLHEDDVLIYAYLSQCNYQQALEIAKLYLQSESDTFSALVTAIILMGRLFSEVDAIKGAIGTDYYNLIVCCKEARLYTGDKSSYLSVFSILEKYGDRYDSMDFLGICGDSDCGIIFDVAEILLADHRYGQAIDHYKDSYFLPGDSSKKTDAAFKIGYCYYKLKQYCESLDWFEKAIISGYSDNDLFEFLRWIGAQSADHTVKQKVETLSVMHLNSSVVEPR